jgi:hypothetical protein
LKKILTLTRRRIRVHPHVRHIPLAPRELRGVGGCMALAPHLRMVVWPRKFRPHLSEKYDGTVNLAEFLQIYSTSILAAGGIMANYFPVALTGTARSWLMNLPEGTLDSWSELCRQFTANIESAYARPGNETDLHAVQQRPGESLRSFIQRFSQVRNTIPRIFNASVVLAFCQGVRDEKMLEKLATHDIQDVSALFSLADKCARAAEGVRNRTLTLIEREDDTRSWGNFLVYFSHSTTMSYPPRGWGYILIGC